MYDVDYFIKKFSTIPEDRWIVGSYHNSHDARCAIGHCALDSNRRFKSDTAEADHLESIVRNLEMTVMVWEHTHSVTPGVIAINDGYINEYQQDTPKERMLAALRDVKKLQQPKYEDITKELAVLPVEEVPDQKLIKHGLERENARMGA